MPLPQTRPESAVLFVTLKRFFKENFLRHDFVLLKRKIKYFFPWKIILLSHQIFYDGNFRVFQRLNGSLKKCLTRVSDLASKAWLSEFSLEILCTEGPRPSPCHFAVLSLSQIKQSVRLRQWFNNFINLTLASRSWAVQHSQVSHFRCKLARVHDVCQPILWANFFRH